MNYPYLFQLLNDEDRDLEQPEDERGPMDEDLGEDQGEAIERAMEKQEAIG